MVWVATPNAPSSATRRTGRYDGHRDAPAGFAAARDCVKTLSQVND